MHENITEIEKPELLNNTLYSEIPKKDTLFCRVCAKHKTKDNFYKFTRSLDNLKILKEEYIYNYCKECMPIEAISISLKNFPLIDKNIIYTLFYNKQLARLKEQRGLVLADLISRKDAAKQLNINNQSLKDWFKVREDMGIINPIRIINNPGNYKEKSKYISLITYTIFYTLEEFYKLKELTNNGYFQLRTDKIIQQGETCIHRPPYIYISNCNKEYLYVNLKERTKPCSLCLEIIHFNKFYNSTSTRDKLSTVCKICSNKKAMDRYNLLTIEEKRELLASIKKWKENNKNKIKLYKTHKKRNPQNKAYRNARDRLREIIRKIDSSIWAEYYKNNPNTSKTNIKEIGCTLKEFIIHIESKFIDDMCWENYGPGYKINNNGKPLKDENNNIIKVKQWQIDHIKPVSSFNFDDINEVIKINHYTNLLPMWADDNNYKSNKEELCPLFDKEFLEKYKELEVLTKKYKKEIENAN